MDAEMREHVFEPFYGGTEGGKKSGMGLATAYGIVKQHGGFIHVYSEVGQGTLFRAYLPSVARPASKELPIGAKTSSQGDVRGTETLLLAEDHDSTRDMARHTLVNLGYRVLTAVDGEEALRLCEEETPAMAILDLVMPNMGGPEAATKLAERFENLPVLFTSGYSQESRGAEIKRSRYLQKPYSPSSLGRVVREILDGAKSGSTAGGV
jgi:CheY-like chemotaxis protein